MASDAPHPSMATSADVPTLLDLNPCAYRAAVEASTWQPVPGLAHSKETLAFRAWASEILADVHAQLSPEVLAVRATTPQYRLQADTWRASRAHELAVVGRLPFLQSSVDAPAAQPPAGVQGTLKIHLHTRLKRRYFELRPDALVFYHRRLWVQGDVRGRMALDQVVSLRPGPQLRSLQLQDIRETWLLQADTDATYNTWVHALVTSLRVAVVDARFHNSRRLAEQPNQVRVVVSASHTVGETVALLFAAYIKKRELGDDPKAYVLKVTGYRDYLIDRHQVLGRFQHVRHCLATNETLHVTLVHQRTIQAAPRPCVDHMLLDRERRTLPDASEMTTVARSGDCHAPLRLCIYRALQVPRYTTHLAPSLWSGLRETEQRPLVCKKILATLELYDAGDCLELVGETSAVTLKALPPHPGTNTSALIGIWVEPHWFTTTTPISKLPRTARLVLTLYNVHEESASAEDRHRFLSTGLQLFDADGRLRHGEQYAPLFDNPSTCTYGPLPAIGDTTLPLLHMALGQYERAIEFDWRAGSDGAAMSTVNDMPQAATLPTAAPKEDKDAALDELRTRMDCDPLLVLTTSQQRLLWAARHAVMDAFEYLPHVLACVDWSNAADVAEMLTLLPLWAAPSHTASYIALLDLPFAHEDVRQFAADQLATLPNPAIRWLLPQLVQALKFESYLASPLVKLLMTRALQNPSEIGLDFFWAIKTEVSSGHVQYKPFFGLLLNIYAETCAPAMRSSLHVQDTLFSDKGALHTIALEIEALRQTPDEMLPVFRQRLHQLNKTLPSSFQLPLDARLDVRRLRVDKCKLILSAKLPFWLEFENADVGGDPIVVVFVTNTDVRQHSLIGQLLCLMDELWRADGHDFALAPYRVVATGARVGLVSIVQHASTVQDIHVWGGGGSGDVATTAFSDWIQSQNGPRDSVGFEKAADLFSRSAAGYGIATHVLGILDRRIDTLMLTTTGRFLHIQLEHLLGGVQYDYGGQRTAPPLVTRQVVDVLGGPDHPAFLTFESRCVDAIQILRRHLHLLVAMLVLMLPANLRDLRRRDDMSHVVQALSPETSSDEMAVVIGELVKNGIHHSLTHIPDALHLWHPVVQGAKLSFRCLKTALHLWRSHLTHAATKAS
ncbi:hypothetical protein SDRG_08514 [Saprolegnia diclina VS20]|uniref:PH domain-containing protein n=1 Tax=Saprolegnia diclina (strain VS20) TaxID=1156394 RepID=T0RTX5_SAPDV|nr:hypothetical protein SDRG_08514 [Saprolegnia diclina VS20]EQC33832.1 hypothetical protein SDRG_08514 [Saprolegnia diclina VS20]|eukprot:XP_008612627.1 hypothetical protein SDRG_08514 [Saprolegnia diclina VS20]